MAFDVTIIGAGLAGCEAALGLARRGLFVEVLEQKPIRRTEAQRSDHFCELVCSNSFRGAALTNAVGLLKEEMRRLGSFTMKAAELARVPAGGALAVDRDRFSSKMTEWVRQHPRISVRALTVESLPEARPLLIATGPLTGSLLASALEQRLGRGALAYYDAISPIVSADSIDYERAFFASRWGKGETEEEARAYLNCPMSEVEYEAFVQAVLEARKVEPKDFEEPRYFEGCLPIEVMAERGRRTLAFGPMKPIGLWDPRTGKRPFAVVQLRQEDAARTAFNIVGFQTRMAYGEQVRVFRMIPGLEQAEFLRLGAVHRNTFINAPQLLDGTLQLKAEPGLYFAGQITGTEGYVESAAGGWLAAHFIAERLNGHEPELPPPSTAHGGLLAHLSRPHPDFQPSNITFSHLEPWTASRLRKQQKYAAMAERALSSLELWQQSHKSSRIMASANSQDARGMVSLPSV